MRKTISILTMFAFLLCLSVPGFASDEGLKKKIQSAMENHAALQVDTSHNARHFGYVVDVKDEAFTLLNPMTQQQEDLNWGSVKSIKEIKASGRGSKPRIDSWVGKDRALRIELMDGSKLKGRITQVDEDSFVLRDAKTGNDTKVWYDQVKKADDEPGGQKTIRNVMISVGVGLAGTLIVFSALLAGD